jgi:hypothetical protein
VFLKAKDLFFQTKRATGLSLIELLVAVALFVSFTAFLMQAFNLGFIAESGFESTNLAVYLATGKIEQIRNLSYASIVNESRAPIAGYPGYESQVTVTQPAGTNANLKKVVATIFYQTGKAGVRNVPLQTLVVNN